MLRLLRSGLLVALLICSAITIIALAQTTAPASAGSVHTAYLPAVFNDPDSYELRPGSPTYLSNFLNSSGCNWFGFVGRAFGGNGSPVVNLTVHLQGGGINADVLTGSGPSALGPGGYEIPLSDHPIETTGVYFVQLRTNAGASLSDTYMIPTYADCSKNAVMVNFTAHD